ncbi:MAG: ferritin-like domain-containing protein [Negativicutes bacterium]|nr:ferritin-like domain-containing protein [Negativicutes bacterium]
MRKHARRPKYMKTPEFCIDDKECPNNPDLLLLRDAAADERKAVLQYLNAARDNCLAELFLDVAEDEMHHYVEIMQQIVRLDSVQADMFREVNLNMMTLGRPAKNTPKKWNYMNQQNAAAEDAEELSVALPDERDMPAICHLTAGLVEEFAATNKYQRYMNEACDPRVKELFCHLMNEEKEHIAEFTAALFDLTGEPLPHEHEED